MVLEGPSADLSSSFSNFDVPSSDISWLDAMCRAALDKTHLLPHCPECYPGF